MARAGVGPIIPDRGSSKKPTAQPARLTPNQADRASSQAVAAAKAAQIARDRASSAAAFKASGLSASAYIRKVDNDAAKAAAAREAQLAAARRAQDAATATAAARRAADAARTSQSQQNQSNSGNDSTSGEDGGGSGQSAVPESFTSSDSTSSSSSATEKPPIKSAPIDTVIFADEAFSEEFLVDVLFEDLVGQELLTIARGDTVNGQEVIYQPIKNLGLLQGIYNPNNILGLADTSATFFSSFVIQLSEKIPTMAGRRRSELGNPTPEKNYYVDQENGDIIIELINIVDDEQVEIQLATSGTIDRLGI